LYASAPVTYSFVGLLAAVIAAAALAISHLADAWRTAKRAGSVPLRWYNRWFVYLLLIGIHALVVVPQLKTVIPVPTKAYRIPTSGMEPSLLVGDYFVADRECYQEDEPQRGDVIVFAAPGGPEDFIKRVIGLPGETVELRGERVFINGTLLNDNWGVYKGPPPRGETPPVRVPPGAYFVLGDNRYNSYDSRHWGCLARGSIKGKALYIYWARDKGRIGKSIR
jgi:signal peptidase I